MADAKAAKIIDKLLEERRKYETWLHRLDATSDTAPEAVRERVQADYQRRLAAVTEDLRSHGAAIAEQLAEHRVRQDDLTTREAEAEERMAEAEVRHAVGEYGEDEWEKLRADSHKELTAIRSDLEEVGQEIDRLAEVQALIAAPALGEEAEPEPEPESAAAAPEPPEEPEVEPVIPLAADEADDSVDAPATVPPAAGAPRFVPRGAGPKDASPPKTLSFPPKGPAAEPGTGDELAFLKSVTEDDEAGPSPQLASGGKRTSGRGRTATPGPELTTADPLQAEAGGSARADRPTGAKTLKCTECGAANRPTEWYCEQCGAELASL